MRRTSYTISMCWRTARGNWFSVRALLVCKHNPSTSMQAVPCAYLLAPDDCNNDSTNYWIFSESGLRRLLERTGWAVERFITVGDMDSSNPSETDHDEPAFVLAKSIKQ